MNSNRRVLLFVVYSVLLFLLLSVLGSIFHFKWMPFRRVNLISDIITKDSAWQQDTSAGITPVVVVCYRLPEFGNLRGNRYKPNAAPAKSLL